MSRASTRATSILRDRNEKKDRKEISKEGFAKAEVSGGGPENDKSMAEQFQDETHQSEQTDKKPPVSPNPRPTGPHGEK